MVKKVCNGMKSWRYIETMKQNQECGAGNQKRTGKFLKCLLVGLSILTLGLLAESVEALQITVIDIPMVGANYNGTDFYISGRPSGTVQVIHDDGSMDSYNNIRFNLDTVDLDAVISDNYLTATYTGSGGTVEILDSDTKGYLLIADLKNLRLEIIDPNLGCFTGEGDFLVTGGTLNDVFGSVGGLATIGLSWKVPASFEMPFYAMANTKLYPEASASIPDVTTLVLLGSAMLIGSLFGRKKAF